jgi:hypothetical protein
MWTYWGVGFGLIAPMIMFLIEYRIKRKLDIVMSPREWIPNPKWPQEKPRYLLGDKLVDFVPRMQQYTKTAEIMITLASASILFVPSHLSKHPVLALSVTWLGFAVLWGVLFIVCISYCYEGALYDPNRFGAFQSSLSFALGFGALGCFAVAYIVLALAFAHAIALGQPLV